MQLTATNMQLIPTNLQLAYEKCSNNSVKKTNEAPIVIFVTLGRPRNRGCQVNQTTSADKKLG
jgi:hypothetical protein